MKKLPIFIMLFVVLLVPIKVYASEVVFNISDFGALGDLGYGLIGGAQFDFDGSRYVIGNYDNLSSSEKEELLNQNALQFLLDYAEARKLPVPDQEGGYYQSLIFEKGIREAFNQYQYDINTGASAEAYAMTLSRQRFSDWAMYQDTWYSRYISSFEIVDTPSIEVNPDPNYIQVLDYINGSGFWWKDAPNNNLHLNGYATNIGVSIYPPDLVTWFGNKSRSIPYVGSVGSYSSPILFTTNIISIYINGSDDNYSFNLDISNNDILTNFYSSYTGNLSCKSGYVGSNGFDGNSSNSISLNFSHSGTLMSCLNYISYYFRNVNILVNGEYWALVGDQAASNPVIPDFPDVINVDSGDPIGMIDLPNTDDFEGSFDITSLFDALKEAIAGASDNDNTSSGVLTGDAVKDTFKDKAGELVGSVAIPISTVIDDSFPIEGSLNYPNIVPYAEPISNAFMGTTILAQLIDATQTVLPEPLILVFWGIVFILFIIGLIKILHK